MNKSVSFQNAASREIGDFELVIHFRRVGAIRFDGTRVIVIWINRSIVGEQRMAFEANRFLQLRRYHIAQCCAG